MLHRVKATHPDQPTHWLGRGQLKRHEDNATHYNSPSAAEAAIASAAIKHPDWTFTAIPLPRRYRRPV